MTTKLRKVAIYGRVSTLEKQDPEMQFRELREYCRRRGWKPETFTDRETTRKTRPGLESLKAQCRRRRFDVVVVYRFDRFARSSLELLTALEEFRSLGIDFVSLHENVDSTTPQGKLMFAIIAAFAEFEREILRERTLSGLARARAEGKRLGRPRCEADARQIASLRKQGVSWPAIAEQMGVSRATAIRALQ